MHPRKWVIALACIALVLGGLLYGGVVFFEKSRDVKRLIVQAISASTGSGFSVERIRLGFLSVYLENVTIGFSTPFYRLAIHDIKVGFSLKNLILYKGDVGKSINRLILINPELSVFVNSAGFPSRDSVKAVPADADIFSAMRSFPVDHFLVRKGTVRLCGIGSDGFTIGENLTGGISSGSGGVEFDLHGSLASHKKNFALSGLLSKETRRSRISISINKARIDKPIRWNNSELHSGVIDGVCEYSVPDSMTPGNIESRGWVTLGGATVKVDKIDKPITGLAFSLTFLDSRIRIDSAVCKWNGIAVKGSGIWNLFSATDSSSAIDISCQGIKIESLFPENSKNIGKIIRGTGWGIVRLSKGGLFGRQLVSVAGGGISAWNSPVILSAKGSLERGRVLIESCVLKSPTVTAGISGIVNYAPAPVSYSLEYTIKADSLPQIPDLKGSGHYSGRGTLKGIGAKSKFRITVNGNRIRYFDAPVGDPEVTLTGENINHIIFDCNSPSFFHASGMLDSIAGGKPVIRADLSAGSKLMPAILERKNPSLARIFDSAGINSTFYGNAEEFDVIGKAELYSHIMHGGFQFRFNKYKKNKAVSWRITQQNMYAGDSLIPFSANGSIDKNSLRIDSFNVAGAIHGAGRCGIDAGGNMDIYFKYKDLSVCALNTWFMHRSLPAKKGIVSGNTRISGIHGRISTESEIHLQDCSINDFNDLETDVSIKSKDTVFTILPGVIKKEGVPLVSFDTVSNSKGFFFSGHFDNIPVKSLLSGNIPEEYASGDSAIKGYLSGVFYSVKSGDAARITVNCPFVEMGCWKLDSINADLVIDKAGINVERFYVTDSNRTRLSCNGNIPWTFLNNAQNDSEAYDTMSLHLKAEGDLLATFEKNISKPYHLPVAGKAKGTVDIEISGASGVIRVCKVTGGISNGILRVKPYVAKDINDFSLDFAVNRHNGSGYGSSDTSAIPPVDLYMKCSIDKKPIRIYTSHTIPHGFESLKAGLADLGVIHVVTPQGGVNLHLPGLMAPGVTGEIEFKANKSYTAFMLSGPVDRLRITGTCILHNGEFTFPPLSNSETVVHFDPFPYITWDMDLKAANRKLKYFYDAGTKSHKLIRMVECYLDPVSNLSLRGRDKDHTFRILGSLRSYKGSIYFRRTFEENFEVGLDFLPQPLANGTGYDNMPIIWGSAEAVSENSRFEKVKLTLNTRDSISGAISEKGRFHDISFRVSSDGEETPGESELTFFTDQGKKVASVEGAGELVSTLGEQYVHRFLLQNMEDRLAKSLGLDVITFETAIASNYFNRISNRQMVNFASDWSYLAFANVGLTFGRYFFYDKILLKWRTELVPIDTLIKPEYTMGFEFQPINYFTMDFDYGVRLGEKALEYNPKVYLQLRLPIENLRKYLKF